MKHLKKLVIVLALVMNAGAPSLILAPVALAASTTPGTLAANTTPAGGSAKDQACEGLPDGCSTNGGSSINSIMRTIINLLSVIVGIVAVVMIIIAGLRYITSGGDANKVGGAKNALIYALVGIVVVALAQILVHFVLGTTTKAIQ